MLHVVRFPHGAANGLLVVLLASLSVGCSLKAASKGTTLSLVLPNSSTRLSQLGGPPVHGVVPSQWNSNSFACYGVNVVGPGISDTGATPTATQFSNFSALASGATACSYRGVVSNTVSLAAAGGSTTIDLQVPAGSNRIIQLVGITDAANCGANFLNPTNAANSVAYLIGTAAADLQGDTTVNIPISYSAANPKRVDCLYGNAVTVLPVAAMTSHSSGYFNASESSGTSITGTCTEIGQTVTLTSGANSFGPYTCTAGLTWDITIDATFLATIPNGSSATFTIQTTSATGNAATPTNFTIVKDTTAPANPSAVALVGVLSPNHFTDISVQVAGVTSGDTVKLYSAASCTGTLLATATAASSSVTIAVALGADSTYDFYPKVIDPAGNSVCGSAHETYILDTVAPVVTAVSLSPYSGGSYTGSSTYFNMVNALTLKVFSDVHKILRRLFLLGKIITFWGSKIIKL